MNHDLIKQLQALTPTEGEWEIGLDEDFPVIETRKWVLDSDFLPDEDRTLITVAPTMRTEILAMAKEIEELREENRKLQFIIDNGLGERDLTNDI